MSEGSAMSEGNSQSEPFDANLALDDYFDGTLDSAGRARLQAWLKEDPQRAAIVAQRALLHSRLSLIHNRRLLDAVDRGAAEASEHETGSSVVPSFFKRVVPAAYWLVRHDRPVSWVAAAVVMIIAVGAMALLYTPKPGDQALRRNIEELPTDGAPATQFAARLARLHDAEWGAPTKDGDAADVARSRSPETLQPGSGLLAGDRFYLKHGLAEINFARGAVVVLEGPAHFRIDGGNNCGLEQGKLVARVETREAKGFAVRTPTSLITDLGTEFGVAVHGQETSLTVLRGAVTTQSRTVARDGSESLGQVTQVIAGQGARVDNAGHFAFGAPDKKMFATTRLPSTPYVPSELAYAPELVVSSDGNKPWNGWGTGVGLMFRVAAPIQITKLGTIANNSGGNGNFKGYTIQMFQLDNPDTAPADAKLLATATIQSGQTAEIGGFGPGGWFRLYMSPPDRQITLVPGKVYVVAGYGFQTSSTHVYIQVPAALASQPTPYKPVKVHDVITHLGSRYGTGGVGIVPDMDDKFHPPGINYCGPTFAFRLADGPADGRKPVPRK